MRTASLGSFEISFSHNQFLLYDVSVAVPQCEWTEEHCGQGVARRESAICLGTILQAGTAEVRVYHGPYLSQRDYQRVISNPFRSPTGRIVVGGLLEMYIAHLVQVRPGDYRVYTCQSIDDPLDDHELIDQFFLPEERLSSRSEILLADEGLSPPSLLIEEAAEMTL